MDSDRSSYRSIVKATSIFGGVQLFQIIIQIIRSKVLALLIGPAGFGLIGLLNSTLGLIGGLTNFGLGTSSIKNIAEVKQSGNKKLIFRIIIILRKLILITGFFGLIFTIIFSPWLSQLTFGNKNYTLAFVWISLSLLFNQLNVGELAILQGLRKIKFLAKANLFGNLLGLLVTLPLYYIWRIDAIVPGIILTSLITFSASYFYSRKIKVEIEEIPKNIFLNQSKEMLSMGFMISLSSLITLAGAYFVRIYINRIGGVNDVGLYSAGFAIIGSYVGLIFSAMGTDYYPRLSATAKDNISMRNTVNQQAEVTLLILGPIIMIFIVFIHWLIIILYSDKFLPISEMIYWASLGIFFKALSWAIAFIFLAKGAAKLFFWNELSMNIYLFCFNITGYFFWGLKGLGISFLLGYIFYLLQVFIVVRHQFNFILSKQVIRVFILHFFLALLTFIAVKILSNPYNYIIGSLIIIISSTFSILQLDKRIGILEELKKLKQKK